MNPFNIQVMKLEISQDILNRADRCTKLFKCCSGRPEDLCEAEVLLIGEECFVCKSPDICAYKLPFGAGFFCTCPVRREIFDKYGK